MWLLEESPDEDISLNYPAGPNGIIRVLFKAAAGGTALGQFCRLWRSWIRVQPGATECGRLLEALKGKQIGSLSYNLQKERSLPNTSILAQWESFWIPDLRNPKVTRLFSFKPLLLW